MPLYEVVLEQSFESQQVINRWNYVMSGTPAAVTGSFALISAMGGLALATALTENTVMGEIQDLQNASVTFVQITARAIYIDDDFYGNAFLANTIGSVGNAGSAGSPIDAYGFRSSRVKQSIRRGYKRFVGIDTAFVGSGGRINNDGDTQMAAVALQMGDVLAYTDDGNSLSFAPCIASKLKYTTDSDKIAYKYYETEAEQATHLAVGVAWEAYDRVSSQVSRQYGRGS
jgi:hypothetical protein